MHPHQFLHRHTVSLAHQSVLSVHLWSFFHFLIINHHLVSTTNQFDLYLYDGTCQHFDFSYQSEFVYEIEHFHQCLKQRTESSIMTKEKTIQTVELVEQLQQEWQKV